MKRRGFIRWFGLLWFPFAWRVQGAQSLVVTPSQTEGPFYPIAPIAMRADLLRDGFGGVPLRLRGRVLTRDGEVQRGVKIEIWQCDRNGIYDHPSQYGREGFDGDFAGSGATVTDGGGGYGFRTMLPVAYQSRPPHIHVKLWRGSRELLTTQLYLQGNVGGKWAARRRERLQIDPQVGVGGELGAGFDFVV